MTYKEFIENVIITEEEFNKLNSLIPVTELPDDIDTYTLGDVDCLAEEILNTIVPAAIMVSSVDIDKKIAEIDYYDATVDELLETKEILKNFTIPGFDEMLKEAKEEEKDQEVEDRRKLLLNRIDNYSSLEDLERIAGELMV